MTDIPIRHLLAKRLAKGKTAYYWNPTKKMRAAGFSPEALGSDGAKAATRAEELNAQWDAAKSGRTAAPSMGTFNWLIKKHQGSKLYDKRSKAANQEVDRAFKIIGAEFGEFQVASFRKRHAEKFYDDQCKLGSVHRANMLVKWLRYLLNLGIGEELVTVNPAAMIEIVPTDPRDVIWEDSEIVALEAAAVTLGRPSIALAVRLAYDLGQRLSDVLRLTWTAYNGLVVRLTQSKAQARAKRKGEKPKLIEIAILPELKGRLDATAHSAKSPQIVTSEHTGHPYSRHHFNKVFREARKAAGISGKQFLDIRRSAAVRLAEAGCTTEEIVAITGHDIAHGARILETYVPRTAQMGRNAIAKLGEARKKGKRE